MTVPTGRAVANLVGQRTFGLLAMSICLPSMPSWQSSFAGSATQVQLTFSGFVLAYGLLQLWYGPWSDRHGRKPALIIGLAVACIGSVAAALATSLPMLIAARVLQGAGCAAGMVVGQAMVQDMFQGPERTRVMAYLGMAMGLCPPLATLLGGQLHTRLGWQANFVFVAVLGLVLAVAAWRGLPEPPHAAPPSGPWWPAMRASYARLAREPVFLLFVTIVSMVTGSFYAFLSGAPLVLGNQGVAPEAMGLYIMLVPLSYIAGNYCTSRLVRRWGEQRWMHTGLAISTTGLLILVALAAAGWKHPLAFALPMMLVGLGQGFLMPVTLTGTISVVPALAGAAAAVAGVTQQLMGAAGGYAVGLTTHDGAFNLGLLMLGMISVSITATWALGRQQRLHGN